jgi:hypothetical protein
VNSYNLITNLFLYWSTFLIQIAVKVLSMVASVASVDRVFKAQTRQQTKDRNRLGDAKNGRLALITSMLALDEANVDVCGVMEPDILKVFYLLP